MMKKTEILYFEKPGKPNTAAVLEIGRRRAEECGIKQVVVATTHGYTGLQAAQVFEGMQVRIIGVSINAAFDDQGWTMTADEKAALEAAGVKVLTAGHSLGDDVNEAFGVTAPNKIVRETLYTFCQGMKVAVECMLMAADAGLLDMTAEVLSIAGTDAGADTALILTPAYARTFKHMRIREILAKPR